MTSQIERPLSPFMTYRWTLTMILSIVHRVTGVALYAGTLLLAWGLISLASSPACYAWFQWAATSWIGRIVEIGYTWALLHHALSGVRYLFWDLGYGFGRNEREWLTQAALIGGIVLTIALWTAFFVFGAAS